MTTVMMEQMSWPEFRDRVAKNPVVFLPCGATEQHGPHLPLSVDALMSAAVAREVAEEVGGIVAPTLHFGYKSMPKSGGGPFFAGTINLDASTLIAMVRDVIRELVRHGVRKACAIVGHYENQWIVTEGIDLAMRECGHTGLRVMRLEYWDFCTEDTLKKVFPDHFPGVALEHAAVMETSMMLHYYHEMVRLDIAFHDDVFAAAGHTRLVDAWDGVRCQVHLFLLTRINHSTEGYLGCIPREHQELVTALRSRDAETALHLFAAHRRHAVDVVTGNAGPN